MGRPLVVSGETVGRIVANRAVRELAPYVSVHPADLVRRAAASVCATCPAANALQQEGVAKRLEAIAKDIATHLATDPNIAQIKKALDTDKIVTYVDGRRQVL